MEVVVVSEVVEFVAVVGIAHENSHDPFPGSIT